MIATLIKALGISIGCSCPMNCQSDQTKTGDNPDTAIITTIVMDEITPEVPNVLSGIQDLSKIYTI
ncbi:hypothetical protein [Flavobacterium silvaticum]|uniref:Uncharacterized protein n=1 Tax=Flavobacterium silvaticum TaxID=1852020 RepID=A0A972FJS6_9FLAO|nr:hypothetical protein [Flavobacterium silvaticum]NMH26972.1 hypothetical protein [Flavobacterium silvaticum]